MLIKPQALFSQLQKKTQAIYIVIGQEHYLLNESVLTIKKHWRQHGELDEKTIDIQAAADWSNLLNEANSYSLFTDYCLLTVRFDKKSLDANGKTIINRYLERINSRCLILLIAPNLPAKQLQGFSQHEQVTLVQASPLTPTTLLQWIGAQLTQRGLPYSKDIPPLIHQYTQGNLLACAQVIEKLSLIYDGTKTLTSSEVKEQLQDQCHFQLYELADACLTGQGIKAIQILQQARHDKTEATLMLWLLTQEIRQLMELAHAQKQQISLSIACSQLKIWPQRINLYEKALKRLPLVKLHQLLHDSQQIDNNIKTNQASQVWNLLEKLAISLTLTT